ncbi:hydroxyneurosporene dehydrogenase [soil metagenome]
MSALDPDRFFNLQSPGSQEWWYFDAIADDGKDALVIVFYAALPFDPVYGVSTLKHLKNPRRHPAPNPLDHCAIGFQWYRLEGATVRRVGPGNLGSLVQAYALNAYRRAAFTSTDKPFRVSIARNRLERGAEGYRLVVETPDVDRRRTIRADLFMRPAPGTEPFEIDLGNDGSPHRWVLAAADGRIEGQLSIDGPGGGELAFQGRGYHDHNAGAEELSRAMRRWEWGRVHFGETTEVYYLAQPQEGPEQSLWITCQEGRPDIIRQAIQPDGSSPIRNLFGLSHDRELTLQAEDSLHLKRRTATTVDTGPFYQRWLSEFSGSNLADANRSVGISEVLDTRLLNHPLFNWMIPFRLKRPRS